MALRLMLKKQADQFFEGSRSIEIVRPRKDYFRSLFKHFAALVAVGDEFDALYEEAAAEAFTEEDMVNG